MTWFALRGQSREVDFRKTRSQGVGPAAGLIFLTLSHPVARNKSESHLRSSARRVRRDYRKTAAFIARLNAIGYESKGRSPYGEFVRVDWALIFFSPVKFSPLDAGRQALVPG
jgi:hypothetical protein